MGPETGAAGSGSGPGSRGGGTVSVRRSASAVSATPIHAAHSADVMPAASCPANAGANSVPPEEPLPVGPERPPGLRSATRRREREPLLSKRRSSPVCILNSEAIRFICASGLMALTSMARVISSAARSAPLAPAAVSRTMTGRLRLARSPNSAISFQTVAVVQSARVSSSADPAGFIFTTRSTCRIRDSSSAMTCESLPVFRHGKQIMGHGIEDTIARCSQFPPENTGFRVRLAGQREPDHADSSGNPRKPPTPAEHVPAPQQMKMFAHKSSGSRANRPAPSGYV